MGTGEVARSEESRKIIVSQGSVWPGMPTLNEDSVAVWQKRGADVSAFSKEAEGTTVGYPLTTSSATCNVKVQDAFNQVWLGQQSAPEGGRLREQGVRRGDQVVRTP
ncbi:hypothetical protein ACFYR1_07705 [Streptomyces canus]|uniref:hypothetical protein n=1 Tax=Streptomyces canus TaxID=58343 RepID=UPI003688719C